MPNLALYPAFLIFSALLIAAGTIATLYPSKREAIQRIFKTVELIHKDALGYDGESTLKLKDGYTMRLKNAHLTVDYTSTGNGEDEIRVAVIKFKKAPLDTTKVVMGYDGLIELKVHMASFDAGSLPQTTLANINKIFKSIDKVETTL